MDIEISTRDVESRCPYCHDGFSSDEESVDCGVCTAKSHAACVRELRACGACGSAGAGGTIKIVIPKWLQPPAAVREFCGRKHVKMRRQAGVRRSGLCVACQEEWLNACGDEKFRDELVRKRSRGATTLFRRIGSRWKEAGPGAKTAASGLEACIAGAIVVMLLVFLGTFEPFYLFMFFMFTVAMLVVRKGKS